MKEELITFLKVELTKDLDYDKLLEKPKVDGHGDFALPMFLLSKELKKSPIEIAKEKASKLTQKKPSFISKIEANGPYVNFFLNNELLAKEIIKSVFDGSLLDINGKKEKILIEFPSPNTNKPLHLGHVRNMLLGKSISLILEKNGKKVIRANLNNDRGIAICKSMLAYLKYGNKLTPQKAKLKSDHFVGNFYVEFEKRKKENSNLEEEAQQMLLKWEEGDKEIVGLWKLMNDWALQGFKETYEKYGISHDKQYFESDIYKKGKETVLKGLKENIFEKDEDGNIIVDLTSKGLDKKILLRKDGTSIYITQDIALAYEKEKDFKANRYIFVVGSEQAYHFNVLFNILEKLGFNTLDKNYHLSYGMVYLPEGRMKSREGNVVDADDLLEDVRFSAKEELKIRNKDLSEEELDKRSHIIALGAISFFILKFNPLHDMTYNPKESLSFEGETGPYVQYTYARIRSVLKKAKYSKAPQIDYSLFSEKEISLLKIIKEYPDVVREAAEKLRPSSITHYLIRLSQAYNDFYQNNPILIQEKKTKEARLVLCDITSQILKDALLLLGIDTLEEM